MYVVCLLFYAIGRFVYLLFSSAVLRAKGAESIVFDSGLIVTLLLFDSRLIAPCLTSRRGGRLVCIVAKIAIILSHMVQYCFRRFTHEHDCRKFLA